MDLIILGFNHKTNTLAEREACSIPESSRKEFLTAILKEEGVGGAVFLATCNRVELYAAMATTGAVDRLWSLWQRARPSAERVRGPAYLFKNESAFLHLLRVASGLDAMAVGETEIFGQVKKAYSQALQWKATGPLLNFVFQKVFCITKKVRTETGLSRFPVSVSSVAVMLMERVFGDLRERNVLVVGLGGMGRQTAELLAKKGLQRLIVANRTRESAEGWVEQFQGGAEIVSYENWPSVLNKVDGVVSCVQSEKFILSKERGKAPLSPKVLIDLGVPRNIDPSLGDLENIFLYNVDDLKGIAEKNQAAREEEASLAERLIQKHLVSFEKEWARRIDSHGQSPWHLETTTRLRREPL